MRQVDLCLVQPALERQLRLLLVERLVGRRHGAQRTQLLAERYRGASCVNGRPRRNPCVRPGPAGTLPRANSMLFDGPGLAPGRRRFSGVVRGVVHPAAQHGEGWLNVTSAAATGSRRGLTLAGCDRAVTRPAIVDVSRGREIFPRALASLALHVLDVAAARRGAGDDDGAERLQRAASELEASAGLYRLGLEDPLAWDYASACAEDFLAEAVAIEPLLERVCIVRGLLR